MNIITTLFYIKKYFPSALKGKCYNIARRGNFIPGVNNCYVATKDLQIKEVEFNGDTLLAVKEGNKVYVGMKAVCIALGIQRDRQINKIKNHETLLKGYHVSGIPSQGGIQRTSMLELDYLPLWLATINPRNVKPEQKEKLVSYQLKAKDVLANAFIHGNTQASNINNIITQKEVVELLSFKESFEKIINASGFIEISTAAKVINNVHITGRTRLFQYMRKIGLLDKHKSKHCNRKRVATI